MRASAGRVDRVGLLETFVAIVGLGLVVLFCRSCFLLPEQELPMPRWLREGLRFAPLAALAAVVAPEIVLTQGHLTTTWRDPRLFGAAAGIAWYAWRQDLSGTIIVGTAVMLAFRFGLQF